MTWMCCFFESATNPWICKNREFCELGSILTTPFFWVCDWVLNCSKKGNRTKSLFVIFLCSSICPRSMCKAEHQCYGFNFDRSKCYLCLTKYWHLLFKLPVYSGTGFQNNKGHMRHFGKYTYSVPVQFSIYCMWINRHHVYQGKLYNI